MLYRLKTDHDVTVEVARVWPEAGRNAVAIPAAAFDAAFELVPEEPPSVTYGEPERLVRQDVGDGKAALETFIANNLHEYALACASGPCASAGRSISETARTIVDLAVALCEQEIRRRATFSHSPGWVYLALQGLDRQSDNQGEVTYDELERVAALLDEFAGDSFGEGANEDLAIDDRSRWLSEAISYKTAAERLRKVQLTKG